MLNEGGSSLRQEDRQKLLFVRPGHCIQTMLRVHKQELTGIWPQEGAGQAVLSASVEITFDNSDNRFMVRLLSSAAAADQLVLQSQFCMTTNLP